MTHRCPRTPEQATQLLGLYAEADGRLARIQARRTAALGRINAIADANAAPILAELGAIAVKVEQWFNGPGKALLPKGRKSMELGGYMIGSKAGRAKLGHDFEDDAKAVDALRGTRFGKHTTKVTYSLDRTATLKLLQVRGKTAASLKELGFSVVEPGEQFFLQRVEQAGTLGA